MDQTKIRYAVVGLGHIAQTAILPAFKNCTNSELTALVSGDPEKSELLAKKYGISHTYDYDEYEKCLQSGSIDAVYLALPNHLHKDYTIRAAQHKIHVLVEKPMAISSQECEEMIQACQTHGVRLMVAYRLHFEETHLRSIDLITRQRKIGEPRIFQSIHSQPTQFPNIRTLSVSKGGGPTYDIGIYDINAARYIYQSEPVSVFAQSANIGKRPFINIEESMSIVLKFPKERLASIIYSFGTVQTDTLRVVGTEGDLSINPAYTYEGDKTLRITRDGKTNEQIIKARDHFSPEIDYFSDCIQNNLEIEPSGLEGLADIRIVEAIYCSSKSGQVVPIEPIHKPIKVSLHQKISRPPVNEPQPFHAQSPSKRKAA